MLNSELKNVLQQTPLCEYLDPNELDILLTYSKIVSFNTGDIILQQGKKSDGLYLIINGIAVVTAKILGEGATTLVTLHHGNFVGVMSTIGKWPNATSIIASSEVRCLQITEIYFEMLSLFFPETKYKLTKALNKELFHRIINIHNKITNFMLKADMATHSLFGVVIKSLLKPETISFENAEIDINLLHKTQPFNLFNEEEYHILLHNSSVIAAPKQCTLIQEKEKNSPVFLIIRGAVMSSIITDSKYAKLSVLGPMSLFCNLPSLDGAPTSLINYTTCEKAILLKITETELKLIEDTSKSLWFKLSELICNSYALILRAAEKLDIRLNSELYNR